MAYCGPKGIPLEEFLGWGQPSQDAALAWSIRESQRYDDGTHPDDWDPAAGGRPDAFHTHIVRHPGTALIATAQESEAFKAAGPAAHVHLIGGPEGECEACMRTRAFNDPTPRPNDAQHRKEARRGGT